MRILIVAITITLAGVLFVGYPASHAQGPATETQLNTPSAVFDEANDTSLTAVLAALTEALRQHSERLALIPSRADIQSLRDALAAHRQALEVTSSLTLSGSVAAVGAPAASVGEYVTHDLLRRQIESTSDSFSRSLSALRSEFAGNITTGSLSGDTGSFETLTVAGNVDLGSGGLVYDHSTGNVGIGVGQPTSRLTVDGSIAAGSGNTVTGDNAFAFGSNNIASGDRSIALGHNNTASNCYALVSGTGSTASGCASVALGWNNTASGWNSVALGRSNTGSAQQSIAIGYQNRSHGDTSVSIGWSAHSGGSASIAIGRNATATSTNAIALGRFITADAPVSSFVIGRGVSNASRLTNSISHSLMIGFNSDVPTFFVGPSSGAGTIGNVGIGTTSPQAALQVDGDIFPNMDSGSSLGSADYRWSEVWATNGTIQTSDIREKENLEILSYGLDDLLSLNPVFYTWKSAPHATRQLGLIAQEVELVLPEVVHGGDTGPRGIAYHKLIPVIIQSIQELAATVSGFAQSLTTVELNSKRHVTEQLCLGATCVTEAELQALLAGTEAKPTPAPADQESETAAAVPETPIDAATTTATSSDPVSASEPHDAADSAGPDAAPGDADEPDDATAAPVGDGQGDDQDGDRPDDEDDGAPADD